eukprot:2387141-Rhodomonas_salina.4
MPGATYYELDLVARYSKSVPGIAQHYACTTSVPDSSGAHLHGIGERHFFHALIAEDVDSTLVPRYAKLVSDSACDTGTWYHAVLGQYQGLIGPRTSTIGMDPVNVVFICLADNGQGIATNHRQVPGTLVGLARGGNVFGVDDQVHEHIGIKAVGPRAQPVQT